MKDRLLTDNVVPNLATDSHILTINQPQTQNLIQLMGIKENEWLTALSEMSPLPKRYQFRSHHTSAILFASICSAAASFLYADGGQEYGTMSVIGGVSVNLTQNLLYNTATYYFIKNSLQNFKQTWGRLSISTAIGLIATTPSTMGTYDLSHGNLFKAVANAVGNLPPNIFGMYVAIERFHNLLYDNPKARKFLRQQLHDTARQNKNLISALEPERSLFTKYSIIAGGFLLGVGMDSSQTGYICETKCLANELITNNEAASISFGFGAMFPTILIALLFSGMDLGKSGINFLINCYQYVSGHQKIQITTRETKYLSIFITALFVSTWLATYSSAVSKHFFTHRCNLEPTLGGEINTFLDHASDQGAMIFNAAMSAIAIYAALDFGKVAYAPDDSPEKENYKMQAMDKTIANAPIEKIEAFNRKYFPESENTWKKEPSCLTRAGQRMKFWKKDPADYQAMPDEPKVSSPAHRAAQPSK